MRVFLYEWITGGGLVEQAGRLPQSLLDEGSAMIAALAADFAALPESRVTVLRDMRLDPPALPGCVVVQVHSTSDWEQQFDRLAAESDVALVVAPEFDGILAQTARRAAAAQRASLNAEAEFIAVASDKQRTADRLAAAGLPVPSAALYDADAERLPLDFQYPGVLKPIDGAGSQHTLLVEGPDDEPPPYPWPRRLERYCPGRAASVALLCGPGGHVVLPPCWQDLSADGRFTYRGGSLVRDAEWAQRARSLALQAIAAMPPARGYVGVDLVLGEAPDGRDDVVIEINARVTTSYVGLRAAIATNLAGAMLQCIAGERPELHVADWTIDFTANGAVRACT